jgi:hypothetical protein
VELGAKRNVRRCVVRFQSKFVPYRLGRSYDRRVFAIRLPFGPQRAFLVAWRPLFAVMAVAGGINIAVITTVVIAGVV